MTTSTKKRRKPQPTPQFFVRPRPPQIVLVSVAGNKPEYVYTIRRPPGRVMFGRFGFVGWWSPQYLTVLPDDANDPEAVAIIEAAKHHS